MASVFKGPGSLFVRAQDSTQQGAREFARSRLNAGFEHIHNEFCLFAWMNRATGNARGF